MKSRIHIDDDVIRTKKTLVSEFKIKREGWE